MAIKLQERIDKVYELFLFNYGRVIKFWRVDCIVTIEINKKLRKTEAHKWGSHLQKSPSKWPLMKWNFLRDTFTVHVEDPNLLFQVWSMQCICITVQLEHQQISFYQNLFLEIIFQVTNSACRHGFGTNLCLIYQTVFPTQWESIKRKKNIHLVAVA